MCSTSNLLFGNNSGQIKKICVFQVTWNFKPGMVVWKIFYFVKSFYMGLTGKQYGRTEKTSKKKKKKKKKKLKKL